MSISLILLSVCLYAGELELMKIDSFLIGEFDPYSAMGIAILTVLFVKFFIRNGLKKYLSDKWAKLILILSVFVIAELFSLGVFFVEIVENDTIWTMFTRGATAWFYAISGYEGLKRIFNIFLEKK